MRRFSDNDSGQLILIACVSVAAALVLISSYEYSTLSSGEDSIDRENLNSYYYYNSIRETYNQTFEKDLQNFALLHGYSVDFVCNGVNKTIIFVDKDIKIQEELIGGCP
ncbi:MAG: hypothetical protein J5U19_07610 [Candidatus Methanoperedens sp.]|nr:hypothetical protein [Candidatus Methanoperedens sp.]